MVDRLKAGGSWSALTVQIRRNSTPLDSWHPTWTTRPPLVTCGLFFKVSHITVFVLACFVGYMVVWNVSPSLHTPLMSVTNAISGIIVIGGMTHLSGDQIILPAVAVLIATVNIVGGFLVTSRMLEMFQK